MPNVYIEPRPKGRKEGTAIEDYVVEDHKDHVLKTFKTQKEAIDWAKKEATIPSSPASGTRTTRRSSITGGPLANARRRAIGAPPELRCAAADVRLRLRPARSPSPRRRARRRPPGSAPASRRGRAGASEAWRAG